MLLIESKQLENGKNQHAMNFLNVKKLFIPILLILLFCMTVFAQKVEKKIIQKDSDTKTEKVDAKDADLAITGSVTAKELKFEVVPDDQVEFTGTPERKTEWTSERENLPDEVQPNVVYRDIGIKLKITSVFADIDKIVNEALGKVSPETAKKSTDEKTEKTETADKDKPKQAETKSDKPKQ